MKEYLSVNGKDYKVIKLLGHGKGGYSYLVENIDGIKFVLKQIHHEPCDYYTFGNKIFSSFRGFNIFILLYLFLISDMSTIKKCRIISNLQPC